MNSFYSNTQQQYICQKLTSKHLAETNALQYARKISRIALPILHGAFEVASNSAASNYPQIRKVFPFVFDSGRFTNLILTHSLHANEARDVELFAPATLVFSPYSAITESNWNFLLKHIFPKVDLDRFILLNR